MAVKRAGHSFEKLPVLHSSLAVTFFQQSAVDKLNCLPQISKLESHGQKKCHGEKNTDSMYTHQNPNPGLGEAG